MTKDELKAHVFQAIDRRARGDHRARRADPHVTPSSASRRSRPPRLVEDTFGRLGLAPKAGLALTGVRARRDGRAAATARPSRCSASSTGSSWPAIPSPIPRPAPPTPAATTPRWPACSARPWACSTPRRFDHLAGRVVFFAVPAEEYGDVEWRVTQARAGRLEFLGGKPELLRLGHFDDVDLAMMIHTTSRTEDGKTGVPASNNGCIVKTVRYVGRAAHAGGAPHQGINALYAAQIGLAAINAIRETFRDEDTIRVHPIITHGGSQVNVIPGEVRIETYVRGRTRGGHPRRQQEGRPGATGGRARAGGQGRDRDAPRLHADDVRRHAWPRCSAANAAGSSAAEHFRQIGHRTGSTDMGDLSMIMPVAPSRTWAAPPAPATAPTSQIVDPSSSPTSAPPRPWPRWRSTCSPTAPPARARCSKARQAPDDARAVPDLPARHREARGVRGRSARRDSASRRGKALHRELTDLLAHGGADLRRVAVVHPVVDARHRDLLHEVADAVPRPHGAAGGRAGRAAASASGRSPISASSTAPSAADTMQWAHGYSGCIGVSMNGVQPGSRASPSALRMAVTGRQKL